MKMCLLAAVAALSVMPAMARAQDSCGDNGNCKVVAKAKVDLVKAGADLTGACGAFRITNLVAWRLRPSYVFLVKQGGNRAIIRGDGSCINGDNPGDGYATDYLIDRQTGFGYDILSDGGAVNGPQWGEPETAADMVKRNLKSVSDPRSAPFDWGVVIPPGPIDPPPAPPIPPTPAVDLGPVNARIDALQAYTNDVLAQLNALRANYDAVIAALTGRVAFLESRPVPASCSASVSVFGYHPAIHCELK